MHAHPLYYIIILNPPFFEQPENIAGILGLLAIILKTFNSYQNNGIYQEKGRVEA